MPAYLDLAITILRICGVVVLFLALFFGLVSLRELRAEYRIKEKRRENEKRKHERTRTI